MKRSEMVSRLGWYLSKISNNEIGSDEDASDVLEFLEDWGMLPPISGNKIAFETVEDEIQPRWENE